MNILKFKIVDDECKAYFNIAKFYYFCNLRADFPEIVFEYYFLGCSRYTNVIQLF